MSNVIIQPTGTNLIVIGSNQTKSAIGISYTELLFTTPGSNGWTKPDNVTEVIVECWGGGRGGSAGFIDGEGGAGGGGGGYAKKTITYDSPSQIIPYTVGAGGTAGNAITSAGGFGGDTTWNSTDVIARGAGNSGAGGGNTDAGGPANVGDVTYMGGNGRGGVGGFGVNQTGGGGGGAGSTGNGVDSSTNGGEVSSGPTNEFGGRGGDGTLSGGATPFTGQPGLKYGGGGSGGYKLSGATVNGGAGAQGLIRIRYR